MKHACLVLRASAVLVALFVVVLSSPVGAKHAPRRFDLVETTIPAIQDAIDDHVITAEQLVRMYQKRIAAYDEPATGGCLQAGSRRAAAEGSGLKIYLDCAPGIDAVLARVEAAGGRIVAPKFALPGDMGFIAQIRDTEGNEIGLHALA